MDGPISIEMTVVSLIVIVEVNKMVGLIYSLLRSADNNHISLLLAREIRDKI